MIGSIQRVVCTFVPQIDLVFRFHIITAKDWRLPADGKNPFGRVRTLSTAIYRGVGHAKLS
jgi:hypothetical protein